MKVALHPHAQPGRLLGAGAGALALA